MKRMTSWCKKAALIMMAMILVTGLGPGLEASAATSYVKSLTLSKTSATVKAGKSTTAKATVKVSGSASKKVTATSSSKAVATVSVGTPKSGVTTITIKGVKKGTATITVKTVGKNSKKAVISKKIKVTVDYADVTSLTVTPTSKTVYMGKTTTISPTVAPSKANPGVTYTSNDPDIATVTTKGVVKGIAPGITTIIVKTKGKTSKGAYLTKKVKITVKDPDAFTAADYTVEYGTTQQYIEFKYDKDKITKEELIAQGYTVNGDMASMNVTSQTAKYTFNKLPRNLQELKQIKLDSMFAPMAASIVALQTFEYIPIYQLTNANHPLFDMFDYLEGPNLTISNADKTSLYPDFKTKFEKGMKFAYYDGATPANAYTPNKPYSFTLEEGPYYIPAKQTINGYRPTTYMVLISFAGDDSQRYMDVYQSSDGNWYAYDGQWKHLVASIKQPAIQW